MKLQIQYFWLCCFFVLLMPAAFAQSNVNYNNKKLFAAVRKCDLSAVRKMIADHVDLNGLDKDGKTALFETVRMAYPEPSDMQASELKFNNQRKNEEEKKIAMFNLLISAHPDVNKLMSGTDSSILHWALSAMNIMDKPYDSIIVQRLLSAGANVNAQDAKGWTPLMEIVVSDRIDIVKLLLKKGADTSIKNKDGKTALDIAIISKANNTIQYLKSK